MTDTFQCSSRLDEAFDEVFYSAICTAIDVTIKYGFHLKLSSQKMDLETPGFELWTL